MLRLEHVSLGYTQVDVVHDISLAVDHGEIVSMIGANGAGKSAVLRAVSGLLPCKKGRIIFEDMDVTSVSPHRRVQLGIIQIPEGRQVFAPLTVYENLLLGAYSKLKVLGKKGREQSIRLVFDLFPKLHERRAQTAGTLSGGEQQMLAIGRALMAQPKILLMDEPSLGLAPLIVELISEAITGLNREGLTILLVEQNAYLALELASRAYVLEVGRVTMEGSTNQLKESDAVAKTYLGI